jgi:O-antigen ligase
MPVSLAPEETRLAALSMIVPTAVFIATVQLSARSRDDLMMVIVGFALVSALLGMFQAAAGGGLNLDIYRQTSEGYPNGFFANRNHEADLLLIAIPLSTHLIRLRPWPHRNRTVALIIAILFFSISVIATQSRTAFALLPLALAGSLVIWIGSFWDKRVWIGAGGLLIATALGYAVIRLTPVGHHLISRFSTVSDDLRPAFWQGTWSAMHDFWPMGSGVGSFVPVYGMFEDLNSVSDAWVNHAHNDYLELLLETGITGAILMVGYVVVVVLALIRHMSAPLRCQRYAAVCVIAILLGHSITDYPLRTFGLLTLFAFANGLLFPMRETYRLRRSGSHPAVPPPAFALDH